MAVISSPGIEFDCPSDYLDELKATVDEVRFLEIPERRYLMIDGHGAPGDASFATAISTLYPVAYTLHFTLKKRHVDAPVGALEAQFRALEPPWKWRLLLPVPPEATEQEIDGAIDQVRTKGKAAMVDDLVCHPWEEGRAAQILHTGPYDAARSTIDHLHEAIADAGLELRGVHHEIYISDPNRTAAGRLKTLIRQPVE